MSNDPFELNDEKELRAKQRSEILQRLVEHLKDQDNEFYYLSTIEVAHEIHKLIHDKKKLNQKDFDLVQALTPEDIKIIFGLNSKH